MGDNSTAVSVSVWRVVFHPEGPGSNACPSVVLARVHTACRVKEAWLAAPTLLDDRILPDPSLYRYAAKTCRIGAGDCRDQW